MSIGIVSSQLTTDELKTEFRDYKLKVLNGEINFTPSDKDLNKNKDLLQFISDKLPNDIISGSLALSIFGLINRDTNDIDILIEDKDRYTKYNKDGYDDVEFSTPNRLGYREIKYQKPAVGIEKIRIIRRKEEIYTVDFFHNDNNSSFITINFNGKQLKIHNPLEIIDYKLNMAINSKVYRPTRSKHNEDLTRIFYQSVR
jgi:hypothetical protein